MTTNLREFDLIDTVRAPIQNAEPTRGLKTTLPPGWPERTLFSMLLWHIGPPNGLMSVSLPPGGDPDAPWKWDYLLEFPNGQTMWIVRSWLNIEVWVWGGSANLDDILCFLGRNQSKYKTEIKRTLNLLEQYVLFVNPFARHQRMAKFAFDELSKMNVGQLDYPDSLQITNKTQADEFGESMVQFQNDSYAQTFYASTLVTESAFMAEAFLNLLIALFADPTLPENQDPKLFQQFLRSSRGYKIEHLPTRCIYILSSPDITDSRFQEAEKIFNLRNLIAHPYPDYKKLKTEQVWFYQNTPILPHASPFPSFQMGVDQVMPTRDQALNAHETAHGFISFLEDLVDPRVRDEFEQMSRSNPLGWNETKAMFSVPFGDMIVAPFVQIKPREEP